MRATEVVARKEEDMVRSPRLHLAPWPWLVVLCLVVVSGCQDGSGPSVVTSPEGKPAYEGAKPPPPPPADPAIACIAKRRGTGPWDLKVMNADGSNLTTVYTSTSPQFTLPSWSPGGDHIAAASVFNVWRIDVAVVNGVPTGSNPTILLDRTTTLGGVAWSPLGDQIAFHDVNLKTIETIPANGGSATVLYTSTDPHTFIPSLAWSRDAAQIAFTEGGAIRVLTIGGGTTTVLGPEYWQQLGLDPPNFLDWARTQDVLTFSVGASGYLAVYTLDISGGTPDFVVEGWVPTWSPDDQYILFEDRGFKKVNVNTGQITSLGVGGQWPDWRRP
jgi:Tol biopolymer transport system component